MELQYAPPAKSTKRPVIVIAAGLGTTALSLLGVYLLSAHSDTDIMGWYANQILPVGAVIVGLAASSGYSLAAYLMGVKVSRSLLWTIVLLQIGAYFAAEYVQFFSLGPRFSPATGRSLGFFEYFDLIARSFAWKKEHESGTGEALGMWGYFYIFLAIVGFVLGSVILPTVLRKRPYCELCQLYMKCKKLAVLPASAPTRKVKKSDTAAVAAYAQEQQIAVDDASERMNEISALASRGDALTLQERIASLVPISKPADKLSRRIHLGLARCTDCGDGHLQPTLVTGQGKQIKHTPMARIELTRETVERLTGKGSRLPTAVGAFA